MRAWRAFARACAQAHDRRAGHGRVDDLRFYAELIGDLDWVLSHCTQQSKWDEALGLLRKHSNPQQISELFYKYCPVLMQHRPKETVDMLIEVKTLNPKRLIPTLMRYESVASDEQKRAEDNHAIRFLERCIKSSNDPAIHNYLVSLYAKVRKKGARVREYLRTFLTPRVSAAA